jgi:hypothetical protein
MIGDGTAALLCVQVKSISAGLLCSPRNETRESEKRAEREPSLPCSPCSYSPAVAVDCSRQQTAAIIQEEYFCTMVQEKPLRCAS